MRTLVFSAVLLTMGFCLGACGDSGSKAALSCVEICNLGNACPGATQENCPVWCSDMETQSGIAGCNAQWNAYLSCQSRHQDMICSTANPCTAEAYAHFQCVHAFCTANPTSPACTSD